MFYIYIFYEHLGWMKPKLSKKKERNVTKVFLLINIRKYTWEFPGWWTRRNAGTLVTQTGHGCYPVSLFHLAVPGLYPSIINWSLYKKLGSNMFHSFVSHPNKLI